MKQFAAFAAAGILAFACAGPASAQRISGPDATGTLSELRVQGETKPTGPFVPPVTVPNTVEQRSAAVGGDGGVTQVQGNTVINATGTQATTTAIGSGNIAETINGAVGGGLGTITQVQGSTTINSSSNAVTTTANGAGNTARTKIGTLGGN